ncbi:hypothetical protein TVAG_301520 [Trichomonas vaginalis G3]|uniref:Uncharacterized protein n=1 Tax=Trichomonas vaginalis (strain ATCC PRA-98 / G3) TaxID=412133 RepID=A2E5H4_TRIV3|nr:hypothetical protein TVAGG3_0069250 [Trichomonas vaginalis G3]EAY12135.1 hypothetical protein TVAG_301520 [Trichomonas vaginalis G3]KAI5542375.1 hypothetical protein TVAGG3_0069250 [Trichomonas vaginalis G3]|eukprot:XP_001324358.1 hypothetical protein [Trichomonas vaginalis G3]
MAQVAQLGKLPRQILLAFRVLPSDRKNSSFQQEKNFPSDRKIFSIRQEKIFHQTGKNFPSDRKKFSIRQEKIFQLSVRKPFKFSKIENFLVELQEKFFLPTGKSSSFRQEKFFPTTGRTLPSDVPPTESIPKPEEPTAPAPQQTY